MAVVAYPEVDPAVTRSAWVVAVALVLLASALGTIPAGARATPSASFAADVGTVRGNITGPSVLGINANQRYLIQATGGPAVAANGTMVGNITYDASVSGADLTGVQITPTSSAILVGTPGRPLLQAGAVPQVLTISVEIMSVYRTQNASINFTYTVDVVQPYSVAATIVNPDNTSVASFRVLVSLDGTPVGNVSVPTMLPHSDYNLSFQYATVGLASGWHTFTLSLGSSHGLLRFANGATEYSAQFYVPGPAPSYTLWYVIGVLAFVGVLFIFGARLGARRRSPTRK